MSSCIMWSLAYTDTTFGLPLLKHFLPSFANFFSCGSLLQLLQLIVNRQKEHQQKELERTVDREEISCWLSSVSSIRKIPPCSSSQSCWANRPAQISLGKRSEDGSRYFLDFLFLGLSDCDRDACLSSFLG
jgi:hypothetical protein